MQISRIVVTGDLLRPNGGGTVAVQDSNIRWLHGLLAPLLAEATGLRPVCRLSSCPETGFRASWQAIGAQASDAGWAAATHRAPPALAEAWRRASAGALVIGFELPPAMKSAILEAGGQWIDAVIHPVRFMDDLLLGLRAGCPEIDARLAAAALPERLAFRAAGTVAAFAARKGWIRETRPFTLFAAQMEVDRSMIEDGRLCDAAALAPRITAALSGSGRVLYKDHPYQSSPAMLAAVRAGAGSLGRTGRNIYGLLADPALDRVVSVSSGAGTEARYFGREAQFVLGPSTPVLWQGDAPGAGHWSVHGAFLAPDFWRRVLAPALPVTAEDGDPPMHRPDLLRMTLRSAWGYREIMLDAAADLLAPPSPGGGALRRRAIGLVARTGLAPLLQRLRGRG